ncbi:TetR family transcriptional regulator [Sphingopyxis sp. Root214]|uniref:TetR/AcrR family transcriptional regulator n=1 Tax=unclassified Sphingopyxis TaxID=2614943 RepID=UPI0006F8873D|nr:MULTISPECIES: TetR family transcriptional regulator [unclassified Sphingopyxis]KQZ74159.1 TetR family transcriptional regulator [Sphingopyxis sp. Root154]KRC08299.1 TetR family transcriptional regulator [Sphingopyxis sp. Root214]
MNLTIPIPSTRKERADATREAILHEAERVFAATGFRAARLEDMADAVGIRRPSLLHHFSTKKMLYDAVEQRIFENMHVACEARTADVEDPTARLLAHLDAWLDFFVARPTAARILQRLVADTAVQQDNPMEFSSVALEDMDRTLAYGIARGTFVPLSTMTFINGVAAGILFFVCNSRQVGEQRRYEPSDPADMAVFRTLLHKLARTAVLP